MMHNTPGGANLLPIRVEGYTMVADKALVSGLMINVRKSVIISPRVECLVVINITCAPVSSKDCRIETILN